MYLSSKARKESIERFVVPFKNYSTRSSDIYEYNIYNLGT